MLSIVLIEGELRSLIRNSLERIIGKQFSKKYNKNIEIALKISIRAIASLITIYMFEYIKSIPEMRKYLSYILVLLFVIFVYQEYN